MIPSLILVFACALRPTVVDPGETPDADGDGVTEDTAPQDTGLQDTGPPLPCDVPEQEPNSPYDQAQPLPMEQWACGAFSDEDDVSEIFFFENEEPGWLRVWARAFEIGSLADITLSISSNDGPYGASRQHNPDSTDADMIFPVDDEYGFYVTLSEQYGRSGDSYRWELMASQVKAPVEYDYTEEEDNDAAEDANPVADGDRVFGKMDSAIDIDWYSLELPGGRVDLTLDIDAWYYGSPADTMLELYSPDGTRFTYDSYNNENGSYDLDPLLRASPTEGGTWTIKVIPEEDSSGDSDGGGGAAFWYVLDIRVEE